MIAAINFITGAWGLGAIAAAVVALVLIGIAGRALPLWVWVAVIAALAVAIFAQRSVTDGVRVQLADERAAHQATRAAHATQLQGIAEETAAASIAVQVMAEDFKQKEKQSDETHQTQLRGKQQEIDRLRHLARSSPSAVSVRVIGAQCGPTAGATGLPAGTQPAGTGSVGDGVVTLDANAVGAFLDHRAAIERDSEALSYLQDYARRCEAAGGGIGLKAR